MTCRAFRGSCVTFFSFISTACTVEGKTFKLCLFRRLFLFLSLRTFLSVISPRSKNRNFILGVPANNSWNTEPAFSCLFFPVVHFYFFHSFSAISQPPFTIGFLFGIRADNDILYRGIENRQSSHSFTFFLSTLFRQIYLQSYKIYRNNLKYI